MTGNTHVAVGMASSLIILQPKTVPECLCAITGGIIGGMICDIDSPGKRNSLDYRDDPYGWQIGVFVMLVIAFLLGLDYLAGNGAVDYIMAHLGLPLLIGVCVSWCLHIRKYKATQNIYALIIGGGVTVRFDVVFL